MGKTKEGVNKQKKEKKKNHAVFLDDMKLLVLKFEDTFA